MDQAYKALSQTIREICVCQGSQTLNYEAFLKHSASCEFVTTIFNVACMTIYFVLFLN